MRPLSGRHAVGGFKITTLGRGGFASRVLRVLWGSPGCCMTLRNARFGELLQHISGGVVLVVAAALTRVLAVQIGLSNTCCVIMAEFKAL